MHGADHTTGGVKHSVHHDDGDCDTLTHHAQQHEDVGDHHSGEELKEVLNPQVHHPETPELGDREMGALTSEHTHSVEHRNCQA